MPRHEIAMLWVVSVHVLNFLAILGEPVVKQVLCALE